MIQQVQHLMQQAGFAVSLLYGFTLLASLIVMMSAILASQQARLKQWLVLKTLGASHGLLLGIGMAEFLLIGLLAGVLAALLAQISSNMVGSYWLDQPWTVNPTLWLTSVGISCASLLLMALLSQWHYLGFNVKKMAQRVD
jgi:putative ABC transport system permease protein